MDTVPGSHEKLYIVERIPLFASLSRKDRLAIARASIVIEYKKGDVVYRQGDIADALYCVLSGRLKVFITGQGADQDLEYLKRGKYFGIISLLTNEPHSVTVQAVNDSILLKIPRQDFDILLKRIPALAIHFSQTLSRRLKSKDARQKKVFESTIVSVYGESDKIGKTHYAFNLAVGLRLQTAKRVVLVSVCADEASITSVVGMEPRSLGKITLDSPFFQEEEVRRALSAHPGGIDIIEVADVPTRERESARIVALISYLTNDYHYVVVDLPSRMESVVFETMKQSDMVHIIAVADTPRLAAAGALIAELKKTSPDIGAKVKVLTTEYGASESLAFSAKQTHLNHPIFATLPQIDWLNLQKGADACCILVKDPECEYSKTVRRISRHVGDALIGIAFGCGAAQGLAHIGILKVIEKERIPVDIVTGTSIGAVIAAFWASGRSAAQIEEIVSGFQDKMKTLRLFDFAIPRRGLMRGRAIRRFLKKQFGGMTFHDLKMPLHIVACDIETREEIVIESGPIVEAVMASLAIPGVFEPVEIGGRPIVDGGIVNPLPTNVLMKMGVSKIIAINALPSPDDIQKSKKKLANIFDVMVNSIQASEYILAEMNCQNVDIAMHPIVPSVDWYEFYESAKIIRRGEEEALKYLPQLRELVGV